MTFLLKADRHFAAATLVPVEEVVHLVWILKAVIRLY
jgi:hypothetical protein